MTAELHVVADAEERYHDGRDKCLCERCVFVRTNNIRAIDERRDRELEALKRQSEIGPRFARRTFATWTPVAARQAAFDAAVAAARSSAPALWLWGPSDRGKTHLAAAIVNAMLERRIPALFKTGAGFLDAVRASYDRSGDVIPGQRDVVRIYAEVPVLVLDDLGKERFNAWVAERFHRLANWRYEHDIPLVVTSNVHPDELAELWTRADLDPSMGTSIVRRLLEMADGNVVHMP